jgi:proteic killer suppression protein
MAVAAKRRRSGVPLDARNVTRYILLVIRSFLHKGLKAFFETGAKGGIQPHHAGRLGRQLARLDVAKTAADMNVPGWGLHSLTGQLAGHYSITVNGNWRLIFTFDGEDAVLVDYRDYH